MAPGPDGADEQQATQPPPADAPASTDEEGEQAQAQERAAKRARMLPTDGGGEDEESLGSDDDEEADEDDQELLRPAAEAVALRLLEGSGPRAWTCAPEFTHQLFEGQEVPPGYPGLRVELTMDGRTAAWSVDVSYNEEAGRREKAAMAQEPGAGDGDGSADAATTQGDGKATEPPPTLRSSNDGDDLALLKCLAPAVPPLEGAACTINGRKGLLYAEQGFVPAAAAGGAGEKQQRQEGKQACSSDDGAAVAALPFGTELQAYHVTGGSGGSEQGDEQNEVEFAILHALPSTNGVPVQLGPGAGAAAAAAAEANKQAQDGGEDERCRAVATFHRRVQKLAPWFIENGDDVDPEAGEWELLYLVRRPRSSPPPPPQEQEQQRITTTSASTTLAGYLTLYSFNNPLKGKGLRICQALILPPFQRQGHGQRLLRAAYALARERDVVFEVTVEDPCPGFAMLRAVTDTQDLHALCQADATVLGPLLSDAQRFDCLEKGDVARVQSALKLTKNQVVLAYETLKLHQAPEDGEAPTHTKYRLMLKRRRAREVQGEYVGRKAEMQAHLEKFYRERLAECSEILRRAKLPVTQAAGGASQ